MSTNHNDDQQQQQQQEQQQQDADANDPYLSKVQFQSIRNDDGLEEGIVVQWHSPSSSRPLRLSTLLQPDDIAPLFAGSQWAGTRVWHAAIAAVDHLVENHSELLQKDTDCRILELGCGLGVPGMILHELCQCRVVLTDQPSILSQLQRNLQHNFPDTPLIRARPLSWSKAGIQELLQQHCTEGTLSSFDVVLNCDCVYEPLYGDSWVLLVDVMEELLRVNPKALMLTSVERRNADGVDKFLHRLEASPYVATVEQVFCDEAYRIEIYVAHGCVESDESGI